MHYAHVPPPTQNNTTHCRFLHIRLLTHRQSFLIWSRLQIQDRFLQDVALSSSRCCVSVACQTLQEVRENFDRQRLGSLWYILHCKTQFSLQCCYHEKPDIGPVYADIFTSVGILLNLSEARGSYAAVIDPSVDVKSLQSWAMVFLERWSSSNALAARYLGLLQRSEAQLKRRNNKAGFVDNPNNSSITEATLEEPLNSPRASYNPSDTFQWMPDEDALYIDAREFDTDFWNLDY